MGWDGGRVWDGWMRIDDWDAIFRRPTDRLTDRRNTWRRRASFEPCLALAGENRDRHRHRLRASLVGRCVAMSDVRAGMREQSHSGSLTASHSQEQGGLAAPM